MSKTQKVYFKTFGCRTNLFDTQVMKSNIKHFEIVDDEMVADVVVVNSCTVTNGADSGVRGYLNKMKSLNKKVLFTGCGVGTRGKEVFEKHLAHGVFAHSFKENIDEFLLEKSPFMLDKEREKHLDITLVEQFEGKSRAFLKIQEGCDFACSYCVIPSVRGRARSYEKERILAQIRALAENGISEVVLTGTNVGSYGKEFEDYNIARLVRDIEALGVLKRLRIGSLEPSQIDSEFMEILHAPLIERHLHIALQHTSNTMLEIMNRQNRVESDLRLFESLAKRGFCLGSDFIVGHPGESEEVWREAWENFKAFPLTHLHPFVYSKRDGTPSSAMGHLPQVKGDVSKARLHQIKELVAQNNLAFRETHKLPLLVLCESKSSESRLDSEPDSQSQASRARFVYSGLDQFFNRVYVESENAALEGAWIEIIDYTLSKEGNYGRF